MLQKMQQIPINFLKQPKKNSVSPQTEQIEFTIQLIISESGVYLKCKVESTLKIWNSHIYLKWQTGWFL